MMKHDDSQNEGQEQRNAADLESADIPAAQSREASQREAPLREEAERLAQVRVIPVLDKIYSSTTAEHQQLLHELLVHQIELEMQNEELRKSQTELETARNRYFEIYDLAPVGYMILSTAGIVQDVNLTAAMLLGVDKSDVIRRRFSQFLARQDQDVLYLQSRKLLATGTPQVFEVRILHPDGAVRWMQVTGTIGHDARDVVVFRLALNDVTEQRNVRDALHTSAEQMRLAMDAAKLVSLVVNIDTDELTVSDNFDDVVHYPKKWLPKDVNAVFSRFLSPEDQVRLNAELQKTISGKGDLHMEFRFLHPETGHESWLEIHATLITGTDYAPARITGVLQNLTARKAAIEQLRQSEERALALVGKLQRADENKNRFLSTLSHELRNPLAAISMGLSLLERAAPGSDQCQKARDVLNRQTAQLAHLIDDLLDVTRVTANKIKLKKTHVELTEIVKRALADYQATFDEKGILIQTEFPQQPLCLDADPVRLTQVIGNLLHNALKFTEQGGKVLISVAEDDNQSTAVIRIKDTGVGIEPELLSELFQPFIQADNSLSRTQGGLGLGLSIVRGMVELHGGQVEAISEGKGKGAQFIIRLPIPTERRQPVEKDATWKPKSPDHLKILLIEDNPDLTEILSQLLMILGHKTAAAPNGRDGIEKAKSNRPDVVICDIGLPGMNGYEVAETFRNDSDLKDTFLIAMSGYTQAEDLARASAAGFDRHLGKPVDLEKLEQALAEVQPKL